MASRDERRKQEQRNEKVRQEVAELFERATAEKRSQAIFESPGKKLGEANYRRSNEEQRRYANEVWYRRSRRSV